MVVDQNYLRVKKYFLLIFFLFFSSISYSDEYSLTKITKLEEPWGSTFINNDELIITEKDGKIKIININSKNTFEVKHNLNVLNVGQGGLLDIIYQDNTLWISYSENREEAARNFYNNLSEAQLKSFDIARNNQNLINFLRKL